MARRLQQRAAAQRAAAQHRSEAWRSPQKTDPAVRGPTRARTPREIEALPWEFARTELGLVTTDFLVLMLKVVLLHVQDQIEAQTTDSS